MKPQRIQQKRTTGWRMPENTVYVGRPSKWGNPYKLTDYDLDTALRLYRERAADPEFRRAIKEELAGKNLSCWCPPGQPCHAEILLEIANE